MSATAQKLFDLCLFILFTFTLIYLGTVTMRGTQLMVKTKNVEAVIDLDVPKFKSYLQQFNKTYSGIEYQVRLNNFKESLKEIARLNILENRTVFGLTNFSDMSAEEFAKSMLKERVDSPVNSGKEKTTFTSPRKVPSSHKDWREGGYIGPIQNQRLCNGCWAFSTAGVIESMAKIKNLTRQELSVQEILDCILDDRHHDGCNGGNILNTMYNLHYNKKGIVTEKEYPLTLRREKCKLSETDLKIKGVKIMNYDYKRYLSDHDIMVALMNGPVTAVVNAHNWRNYIGGIIKWACPRPTAQGPVHDVQIVGYDKVSDSIPYYIVRNSWGDLFGENGYVRVAMNYNVCGISDEIGIVYDVYV